MINTFLKATYIKPLPFILFLLIAISAYVIWYQSKIFDDWNIEFVEDKKNQILFANLYPSDGWNGATLELLNNNTFRYGSFAQEYKMGNFNITNDTILFDKDYIGGTKAILKCDTSQQDTFLIILSDRFYQYRVHSGTNKTRIRVFDFER